MLTVVFLLGYGLVEIPLSFFRFSSLANKLKHYQCKVAEQDEKLRDKAKKAQTLIQIVKEVRVEGELEGFLKIIKTDVESFQEQVEQLDYFRLTFTPSVADKASREFHGVLDYNKLVRLRNRLIYQTTDVIRLISFRKESIESAILTQDIINAQQRGHKRVQSLYLRGMRSWGDKDQSNALNRCMATLCKCQKEFD